jgi:hypothetical protein
MKMLGASRPARAPAAIVASSLARGASLFALWLLLVDATDLPNLLTGGVVALLGMAMGAALQALRPVRLAIRPAMLRHGHRPFVSLITDTVRVSIVLGRTIGDRVLRRGAERGEIGRIRAVPYRACSDDPTDVGRRVLTEWAASLGANRYVVGVDADRQLLIVHELAPSADPLDPLELG